MTIFATWKNGNSQNLIRVCGCAKKFSLGRTKATNIIRNVIGKYQLNYVCELLRNNVFSLCIDESTDISNKKSLCLVVKISVDFKIYDLFFGLLEVDQCDANTLYESIVHLFKKFNIDYKKNMLGFAADGAAVMTGKNHSIAKLLKNDIPKLFVIKCICHSLALCSSYASLKLPSAVETLTRNIFNYLSNSPKRCNQFNHIQKLLELQPKKLLHPSQTRWLSVVIRILELYECLKIYFSFACNVDQIDTSREIFENLNEENEIYLSFLKYILGVINNINRLFQSESTEIHIMYMQMERLFKTVLKDFIKGNLLKDGKLHLVNYKDCNNYLSKNNVYLGLYARNIISKTKLNKCKVDEIINNCINFYVELCDQILKRFDFENNLKCLSIIDPANILDKKNDSLFDIIQEFTHFVKENEKQDLDTEFRELQFLDFDSIFENKDINLCMFWEKISSLKRGNSSQAFPILSKFIKNIMILPHSSTNVERIFSQINLNKTKIRNALENGTIEGIMYSKDYLKLNNSSCFDVIIKPDLLKLLSSNIYM